MFLIVAFVVSLPFVGSGRLSSVYCSPWSTRSSPKLHVIFNTYRIAKQTRITRDVELRNIVAYLPGNFLARRWTGAGARRALVVLPIASAGLVAAFGEYRPALWASALLLGLLAFAGGARTIVGSAYGLEVCVRRRVLAMRLRAAASQFGYLVGAVAGGLALAAGGYGALGLVFAALFALAALPHILSLVRGAAPPIARAADEELLQVAEVAA